LDAHGSQPPVYPSESREGDPPCENDGRTRRIGTKAARRLELGGGRRPERAARAGAAGKDETLQGSDHRSNRPAPRPRSCRDRSRDVPCFGGCGRGPEGASPAGAGGSPVQTVLSAPIPAAGPDDHGGGRVRVALADRSPSPPLVPQTAGIGRDSRRRRTGASAAGTLRRARTSAQKTKKARADARAPDPSTEGDYADLRLPADSLPLLRSVSSS
jgi:hypothetical protein